MTVENIPGSLVFEDRRTTRAGLLMAVVSAAAFASSGPIAAALLEAGWSPSATALLRLGGGAVVMLPVTVIGFARRRPSATYLRVAMVYGVVAVAGVQFAFFNAIATLPVGIALLIEYLAPTLIVLATWARTRKPPASPTVAGTALSLVGLVLVLDLTGVASISASGLAWALAAAVGLAAYYTLSARELPTMSALTLAGTGLLVGSLVLAILGVAEVLPLAASEAPVELGGVTMTWPWAAAAMILISTVAAYTFGIAAAKRLGARVASFVGLSEVVFAVVFAWVLLDQRLGLIQVIGGFAILGGVWLVKRDRGS